jgi:inosine-uridine nucleoside N-ribohydrolase
MATTFAPSRPRLRVIADNDYSGDPDGLFQLAHLLRSPSVAVDAVIGSHLAPGDPFDPSDRTADNARAKAEAVVALLELRGRVRVLAGSNLALPDARTPAPSAGAEAIVAAAMDADDNRPLYVTLGAGLTELASAYLLEPRIAERLTAIWIGGPEYPELAAPAFAGDDPEYNLRIDIAAAQVVFNDSGIRLWQVPRNVYRQCLVGMTELLERVAPMGALGAHLYRALLAVHEPAAARGRDLGETYILGDNPLVLLTALQSSFEPETTSSRWVSVPAPHIGDDGTYRSDRSGREIRVYTDLDVRLMLDDMFAKLRVA